MPWTRRLLIYSEKTLPFSQRHSECCGGKKTSPGTTGWVDSRHPHTRKQMQGSHVHIEVHLRESTGKSCDGHRLGWLTTTINISSGSPWSLYRALIELAFLKTQISNKQTNHEGQHFLLHHWHFDPWDCKHHPIKLTLRIFNMCVWRAPDVLKVPSKPLYVPWWTRFGPTTAAESTIT